MPYVDGLPVAPALSYLDYFIVSQGGTPGVPGTATARRGTLGELLGSAVGGAYLPLIGGVLTGPLVVNANLTATAATLLGTGTPAGGAYQFQSAISADPSVGSVNFRKNIFNTVLTYAGNTSNIWQNLSSFVTINGPGHANGEIGGIISGLIINAGAVVAAADPIESRLDNAGTLSDFSSFLALSSNTGGGTIGFLKGINFVLENTNATPGAIGTYAAINFEPMVGVGSDPTYPIAIRNADSSLSIVTLGRMAMGSLTPPTADQQLYIQGVDNSATSYPLVIKNAALGNSFFVTNDRVAHFASGSFGPDGIVVVGANTTPGYPSLIIRDSANVNSFVVDNGGGITFRGGTLGPAGIIVTGANTTPGSYALIVRDSALVNSFAVDNAGGILFRGGTLGAGGITLQGVDNSAATFQLVARNLAATTVFAVANDGFTWASAGYKVAGVQVLGPRRQGWTVPTGTFTRGTFDTATATTQILAEHLAAFIADGMTLGMIGA